MQVYQYARKGPKRGVSLYSYSAEYGIAKSLEDCFEELRDMGAHGIEILANTHIENYPNPTDAWVKEWFRLCNQYEVVPVEYGHWIDSHVLGFRDLTTEESVEMLQRDMHLAHRLGFRIMRTKMPVISDTLEPVKNWREIIRRALPLADQLGMCMCPEIHTPTNLNDSMVADYVEFIRQNNTKGFGLNIDFSVFRTEFGAGDFVPPGYAPNTPEDLIPLLPYARCIHAKFNHMDDQFRETTIPYHDLIAILKEHQWDGYLLSEYEGSDKYDAGYEVGQTLRKHHILLKNEIGD